MSNILTDLTLNPNTTYYCKALISVKTFEAIALPIISSDAKAKVVCN